MPLNDLEDDPTWTKRGVSFLNNSKNGLEDKREVMLGRAENHKTDENYAVEQETGSFDTYDDGFATVRFKNGFMQDRNVYIIHGQVAVITRYHKSQSQQDKPKIIPLSPVQGSTAASRAAAGLEYIWGDQNGTWETDRLTRIIARETQKRLKVRLTTHDYRHLAIAIGRVAVGEQFAYGYMSAGRGGEIGGNRYGVSVDVVKYMNDRSINTFRPLSEMAQNTRLATAGPAAEGDNIGHTSNWASTLAQFDAASRYRQQGQSENTRADVQEESWFFGQSSQVTQSVDSTERRAVTPGLLSNTLHPTESSANSNAEGS
ncbi:unnamed protein product [Aureobasidium pullulans]|nr:unnamed protein product [Aureobasidium pullulans]